jgi:hypothetical protein
MGRVHQWYPDSYSSNGFNVGEGCLQQEAECVAPVTHLHAQVTTYKHATRAMEMAPEVIEDEPMGYISSSDGLDSRQHDSSSSRPGRKTLMET